MSFLNITRKLGNNNSVAWTAGSWRVANTCICSYGNWGTSQNYSPYGCALSGGTILSLDVFPAPFIPVAGNMFFTNYYGSPLAQPYASCGLESADDFTRSTSDAEYTFFAPGEIAGISWNPEWITDWKTPSGQNILEYFNYFDSTGLNFEFPTITDTQSEKLLNTEQNTQTTEYLRKNKTGSCCYWTENEDSWQQKTADVNSEYECYYLNLEASKNGFKYRFWEGHNSLDTDCIPVALNKSTRQTLNSCNPDIGGCYSDEDIIGNCYARTGECSISTKKNCIIGYWIGPDKDKKIKKCITNSTDTEINTSNLSSIVGIENVDTENDNINISDPYAPEIILRKEKLTDLQSSTDTINKLPNIGSEYQGGLYVGIFTAGNKQNSGGSSILGNAKSGIANLYNARNTGLGTLEKSWILIAAPTDLGEFEINYDGTTELGNLLLNTIKPQKITTSFSDGYYNTYSSDGVYKTSLYPSVRFVNINGFTDWYIPSQDEWAFYAKNILKNYKALNKSYTQSSYKPLNYKTYWSSTSFDIASNSIFYNYAFCNNTSLPYGSTFIQNREKKLGVRLFRRIYVY